MSKEFDRRTLLKGSLLSLSLAGANEIKRVLPPWVYFEASENDTLLGLCDYYGIVDPENVLTMNKDINPKEKFFKAQFVLLPLTEKKLKLPFVSISLPDAGISFCQIIDDYESFEYGSGSAFCYYDFEIPYLFLGHTFPENPEVSPFFGLRNMRVGDSIGLLRDYGRKNQSWAVGNVIEVLNNCLAEEILPKVDCKHVSFVTCMPEAGEGRRLAVFAEITNYYGTFAA